MPETGRDRQVPSTALAPSGRDRATVEAGAGLVDATLREESGAPPLRRYLLAVLIFLVLVAAGGLASILTTRGTP